MYGGAEVGEKNSFGLHNSFLRTSRQVTFGITHQIAQGFPGEWRYGVVVITLDSESSNPSSNLGSAFFVAFAGQLQDSSSLLCVLL